MYILLTDETNTTPANAAIRFFAYGGLILKLDDVPALHKQIEKIRAEHGYQAGDVLKFDTRSRPHHVTAAQATDAKHQVLRACIAVGCKFIVYVVHHQIARNRDVEQVIEWGASHVIGKFNYFLGLENDYGIVAMDRLPDKAQFNYLSEKFTKGLTFEDDPPVSLDRVTLFTSTCINASHLSSAMDIVLGSWRYCINAPQNADAARAMIADITKMIWCRREGETLHVAEMGLTIRPKNILVKQYKDDYENLLKDINLLLADK